MDDFSQLKSKPIGFTDLKKYLRHRHPMILIDRVIDHEPMKFIDSLMCVSGASDIIAGHFPERGVFPGTHLLQYFAQTGILLNQLSTDALADDELTVVSSTSARFFKVVVPGDRVEMKTVVDSYDGKLFKFSGNAYVDSVRVGAFRAALVRAPISQMGNPLW
jgi:3-hydroxyacyl-[acyl-carrier-protein] dehydratase